MKINKQTKQWKLRQKFPFSHFHNRHHHRHHRYILLTMADLYLRWTIFRVLGSEERKKASVGCILHLYFLVFCICIYSFFFHFYFLFISWNVWDSSKMLASEERDHDTEEKFSIVINRQRSKLVLAALQNYFGWLQNYLDCTSKWYRPHFKITYSALQNDSDCTLKWFIVDSALTELLENEDALPLSEALPNVLQTNKELGEVVLFINYFIILLFFYLLFYYFLFIIANVLQTNKELRKVVLFSLLYFHLCFELNHLHLQHFKGYLPSFNLNLI